MKKNKSIVSCNREIVAIHEKKTSQSQSTTPLNLNFPLPLDLPRISISLSVLNLAAYPIPRISLCA